MCLYPTDHKLPYSLQGNLAIEQSLGTQQTITASYVGAAGRRLLLSESNYIELLNPAIRNVFVNRNGAASDYHGLQLQYQQRLAKGMQALVSYAWSHSLDDNSDSSFTSQLGPFLPFIERRDAALERGSSDFDLRHSFVASLTYDIPVLRTGGFLRALLKDWSLASIIRQRTGTPIGVFTEYPNLRPDAVPGQPFFIADPNVGRGRRLNRDAFAFQTEPRPGTLGRNVIRNFGLSQTDLAVRRQFKLTEQVSLQFRAEFFNLFNHPNFALTFDDNAFLSSPLFGQATNMAWRAFGPNSLNPLYQVGGPRSTQLALKLIF